MARQGQILILAITGKQKDGKVEETVTKTAKSHYTLPLYYCGSSRESIEPRALQRHCRRNGTNSPCPLLMLCWWCFATEISINNHCWESYSSTSPWGCNMWLLKQESDSPGFEVPKGALPSLTTYVHLKCGAWMVVKSEMALSKKGFITFNHQVTEHHNPMVFQTPVISSLLSGSTNVPQVDKAESLLWAFWAGDGGGHCALF